MAVRGGQRLSRFIKRAKRAKSVRSVEIGFFESAKYPDGTPVASVAAWNEFGTETIPERPFFRNAIDDSKKELLEVLTENIDPRTLEVDRRVAGLMGQQMVGRIQRSITTLRTPANKPVTVLLKGSSNPLIASEKMRKSTSYRVIE